MTPFINRIIEQGNANRILSARQIERAIGGSRDDRYRQTNKALERGELVKIRRGLYVLSDRLRQYPVSRLALAQQLRPGSYVSAETALSFHGWIPEAVPTVLSVVHRGNSSSQSYPGFGHFEFARLMVREGYFLHAVGRYELEKQVALIADPMRALMDLMALRKQPWQGLGFLLQGMRVDESALLSVPSTHIYEMLEVYKGKRERHFIESLLQELGLDG